MGIAPIGLVLFPGWWPDVIFVGTALAVVLDELRLRVPAVRSAFEKVLGGFARSHETHHHLGLTWFLVSCTLCTLLFETSIAVAALLFVVVGDAAAAVVGRGWGRHRIGAKSLEGSLACLTSCVAVGWWLIEVWPVLLVGAAVAAVVELLPIPVDDNLRVPLAAATAMWATGLLLALPAGA
jgi:dolichol kinase